MAVIWTLGLEGRSEQQILNLVAGYGIRNVVDIRELPLTREGLPKWPVALKLKELAVRYQNRRELAPGEPVRALLVPKEEDEEEAKDASGKKSEGKGSSTKASSSKKDGKAAEKEAKPQGPDWEGFYAAYKEAAPEKAVRQMAADATLTPTLLISGSRDPKKGPRHPLCEMLRQYDVHPKHIV